MKQKKTPKVGDMVGWRCPLGCGVRTTKWLDNTGANFANKVCYAHIPPIELEIVFINGELA